MVEPNHAGDTPRIAPTASVHASAVLIGNIVVEDRVFIGPNAVIRADEPGPDGRVGAIVIEQEANVQDGVVIHALGGADVRIGRGSSLAHAAVVHGPCEVDEECFLGFNSVVFKVSLAAGVIVMHQAMVEGVTIPPGMLVPSLTAVRDDEDVRRLAPAPAELSEFARGVRRVNVFLAEASRVNRPTVEDAPLVAIVMGSKSDYEVMKESADVLSDFGVPHEIRVISAHRTPDRAHEFAGMAEARGTRLIIAAAGKAAHLAGVLASLTTLPIIGVPMTTSDLGGLDSLLSTVQMPAGIPVATTAIGKAGARNAALLAVSILALSDAALSARLKEYRLRMRAEVEAADTEVLSGTRKPRQGG